MPIDFTVEIDRRNAHSTKWSEMGGTFSRDDLLPMWVADMDLRCAPEIVEVLKEKAEHGIYGYVYRPDSYFQAAIDWTKERFGYAMTYESMAHCSGVVPSMSYCIQLFTQPGDKIVIQSPVYYPFYEIINGCGREVCESPLVWDQESSRFVMDFDDFEKQCSDPKVTAFLLCSPHNPAMRVWTRDELTRMAEICLRHDVTIFSDEIWRDFVHTGHTHIPMASLDKDVEAITITGFSPSKGFNLAGVQASYLHLPTKEQQDAYMNFVSYQLLKRNNAFSVVATETAYAKCGYWLDELLVHVAGNMKYLTDFVRENIPNVDLLTSEATYLMMLDCRKLGLSDEELSHRIEDVARVALDHGHWFGPAFAGYERINLGCPRSMVEKAANGLKKALG
ncbi:putative C-S lyase [Pseudodesulfovibrio sp. JC047]|uniref:MalY/PatB family protein n=1 Tax=Pseudodesulfovibrio sp. JC047 TaxID=2683199 RepID=UPI0013D377C6|nr:MalY/PatB family protein [Pseudodesulfovibrio sp. JC047]NDV19474.1 putative C-S lyase [Pseudodesulfovibrio sp. JC047]